MELIINEIHYGKKLKTFLDIARKKQPRYLLNKLNHFLYHQDQKNVCLLSGLRSSGKSYLMYHAILNMTDENLEKTALINLNDSLTFSQLVYDLRTLETHGFKYIFIDNITYLEEFLNWHEVFYDIDMKFILSGVDHLSFIFISPDEQCYLINTTYIPYYEYQYLLNQPLDHYIEHGCTLSQNDFFTYIPSAIIFNIIHSTENFENGKRYYRLINPYENNSVYHLIEDFVSDICLDKQINLDSYKPTVIYSYLKAMDFIYEFPIEYMNQDKRENKILLVHPGMRYAYKKELLLKDIDTPLSIYHQKNEQLKSSILKEIILLNTLIALENENVDIFQAKYDQGQIDFVIYDTINQNAYLFLINPSDTKFIQTIHKIKDLAVKEKYILYDKKTKTINNLHYLNIEEYLKFLYEQMKLSYSNLE